MERRMADQYFIKRGERINGQFSVEKLQALKKAKKLKAGDEISQSAEGPWDRIGDVYKNILNNEDSGDEYEEPGDDRYDDEYEEYSPLRTRTKSRNAKTSSKSGNQSSGNKGRIIAVAVGGGVVVLAGIMVAVVYIVQAATKDDHNNIVQAATKDDHNSIVQAATKDDHDSAGGERQNTISEGTPATKGQESRAVTRSDHSKAVTELAGKYYEAADWRERYRLCVQSDDVLKLMSAHYAGDSFLKMVYSVDDLPSEPELADAAREGRTVPLITKLNGEPASLSVVYSDGKWLIDWMSVYEYIQKTRRSAILKGLGIEKGEVITLLIKPGVFENRTFNQVDVYIDNPLSVPLWATVRVKSNIFGDLFVNALLYNIPAGGTDSAECRYEGNFVMKQIWEMRRYEVTCDISAGGYKNIERVIPIQVLLNSEDMERFTVPKGFRKVARKP
jgi:hypothetical protein